jgi:DNA replication protein DnaC
MNCHTETRALDKFARLAREYVPDPNDPNPATPTEADLQLQRKYFMDLRLERARIPSNFAGNGLRDFTGAPLLADGARAWIKEWGTAEPIIPRAGITLRGPVGCGKTHLAVGILKNVIAKGFTGLYYNAPELLSALRDTYGDHPVETENDVLEYVTEADLLVLDDLGAEKPTDWVLDRFYLIVNGRYQNRLPLIVTTNFSEEHLRKHLGERLASRLAEMCPSIGEFPSADHRRNGR